MFALCVFGGFVSARGIRAGGGTTSCQDACELCLLKLHLEMERRMCQHTSVQQRIMHDASRETRQVCYVCSSCVSRLAVGWKVGVVRMSAVDLEWFEDKRVSQGH